MKKILENKRTLVIIVSVIIAIVLVLSLIIANLNKTTKIECNREKQLILGIDSIEDLIVILDKNNEIYKIVIDKSIELDNYYQQFDTHKNAIYNHMKDAYKYLNEKNYKVTKEKDRIEILVNTKEEGVILDNLEITRLSESDRKDIKINSSNILESSSSTYKIGDEYKKEELIKKLEGLGYTCKR